MTPRGPTPGCLRAHHLTAITDHRPLTTCGKVVLRLRKVILSWKFEPLWCYCRG